MNIKLQMTLWKLLIFLELINYQIVTVICNDFILFKFLRDILLVAIVMSFFMRHKSIVKDAIGGATLLLCLFLLWAVVNTSGIGISFVFLRKYLSPIILLLTIVYERMMSEEMYIDIIKYLMNLLSILSLWGIFQAFVLGPDFLIALGYPTKFSNAYQAIALKDSFYFGNLGIQRVVSTLSNANVFALILGSVILAVVLNHRKVLASIMDWCKLLVLLLGYVLTFSRANILALIIVALVLIWKYIPKKAYIMLLGVFACIAFLVLYLHQDDSGITHKLVGWVVSSLTFTESSAAGRSGIWEEGFRAVLANPLGLGFGKVGSWAVTAGSSEIYSCESSYLAMALDMGWLGVVSYLILLGVMIRQAYIYRHTSKADAKVVFSVILYMMIAFAFSNHVYDKEATAIIYFVLGFALCYLRKDDARYHMISEESRG